MNQLVNRGHDEEDPARLKQKREAVLAGLCSDIVDRYRPAEGVVTSEMAVTAKVAILDELGLLPIEEFSPTERALRAQAIRNRALGPYFLAQKEQLAQEKEHLNHQKGLQRRELLQLKEEAAMQTRRMTRKATFIEIGVARALKAFAPLNVTDGHRELFEWEIRERLNVLLSGDETEKHSEEAIDAAIRGPLLEWEKRLEQARLAKRDRIVKQCITVAVPLVEAALPWVTATVITKFRETFGVPPAPVQPKQADASSEKPSPPSTPDVATPHAIRTQPMPSADPIVDRDESVPPSESGMPEPQERHRAAS